MVRWLVAFVRGIDSLNKWMGRIAQVLTVVLLLLLLHEVVVRYFFNAPTLWGTELAGFILLAYFVLGGGYALLRGSHVRMDVLYHRWSPRVKAIANLATFPLAAIYLVVLVQTSSKFAIMSTLRQECTASTWGPPLYPLKIVIAVGFGLFLLQVIAFFIRDLFFAFRGKSLE